VIILISNYSVEKRLLELRKNRGFSQEQLALEAGITTSYYGQVERGERNITVHTLEKICNALNVSLADFFSGFENKNPAASDEISGQILYQLNGRTPDEKQAVLRMVKLAFSLQKMKK
jgi:transcriptional regulator with XRE-family HTH domain